MRKKKTVGPAAKQISKLKRYNEQYQFDPKFKEILKNICQILIHANLSVKVSYLPYSVGAISPLT